MDDELELRTFDDPLLPDELFDVFVLLLTVELDELELVLLLVRVVLEEFLFDDKLLEELRTLLLDELRTFDVLPLEDLVVLLDLTVLEELLFDELLRTLLPDDERTLLALLLLPVVAAPRMVLPVGSDADVRLVVPGLPGLELTLPVLAPPLLIPEVLRIPEAEEFVVGAT